MPAKLSVKRLTFSGGEDIEVKEGAVLLVVGPNNVGKSRTIADLPSHLPGSHPDGRATAVLQDVEWTVEGTAVEYLEWLRGNLTSMPAGSGVDTFFGAGVQSFHSSQATDYWQAKQLIPLQSALIQISQPCARINGVSPPNALDIAHPQPTHPLQDLFLNEEKLVEVSKQFRQAFGIGLAMPRAGASLPLHLGDDPATEDGEDRASVSFLKRLVSQPQLQRQGDGMRAFVAAYLQVQYGPAFVQALDEPEAFLHPPQARLLGELLVREKRPEKQLILATHSSDIVRGALAAGLGNVTIVRVTREGDKNHARVLPSDELKQLWGDPIVDFSNVLDGLFHDLVVVCEADGDCRFFSAMLQATSGGQRRPDVLFTWCQGKQRIGKVVRAIRSLGIRARAVADFDVLNDRKVLGGLGVAFGAVEDQFEAKRRAVADALATKSPPVQTTQVKSEIDKLLDGAGPNVDEKVADKIREVLRATSPWSITKLSGIKAVPGGQPSETASALVAELKQLGLFVLSVGELERFCPSIGGHGPAWVAEVVEKRNLAIDPELEEARAFVRGLVS